MFSDQKEFNNNVDKENTVASKQNPRIYSSTPDGNEDLCLWLECGKDKSG